MRYFEEIDLPVTEKEKENVMCIYLYNRIFIKIFHKYKGGWKALDNKIIIKYILDDGEENLYFRIVIWNLTMYNNNNINSKTLSHISRTSGKSTRQRDLSPFDTPDESILDLL